jgi:hypothetical protein
MMRKTFLYLTAVVIAAFASAFIPADDHTDCRKVLKHCIKEMAKIAEPAGNKVYYMSITVATDMHSKSRVPDSRTRVDVYMSSHQIHYVSDVLSTYQDELHAFAVLPQRKVIVWAQGGKRPDAIDSKTFAIQLQDTLVNLSKVISCRNAEEQGKTYKVLVMEPYKKARETFKVMRMEYFIDMEKKYVAKANTYYMPSEDVVSTSVTYHDINLNYGKMKLNKPVYQLIFSDQDKLQAKYKGYQVIDNRN